MYGEQKHGKILHMQRLYKDAKVFIREYLNTSIGTKGFGRAEIPIFIDMGRCGSLLLVFFQCWG